MFEKCSHSSTTKAVQRRDRREADSGEPDSWTLSCGQRARSVNGGRCFSASAMHVNAQLREDQQTSRRSVLHALGRCTASHVNFGWEQQSPWLNDALLGIVTRMAESLSDISFVAALLST